MWVVAEHKGKYSVQSLCVGLGLGRASYCRTRRPIQRHKTKPIHPWALSVGERKEVLGILNGERFWDQAPGQVYATLLDEGRYLRSERTMYSVLAENQQGREISCVIRATRRRSF